MNDSIAATEKSFTAFANGGALTKIFLENDV